MATPGAETIPRTRKSLASQDKVTLPVGKEPVFSLHSGVSPWDLEVLQDHSFTRGKEQEEAEIPSIWAGSDTLSTAAVSSQE